VRVLGFAVELAEFGAEVRAHIPHGLLQALQVAGAEHLVPVFGDETQMGVHTKTRCLPVLGCPRVQP
jgi:hypothetical protein